MKETIKKIVGDDSTPNVIMAKITQIQSICFWISVNSKYKCNTIFNGKDGKITVHLYANSTESSPNNIFSVDRLWLKTENIVAKELDMIVSQLLIFKENAPNSTN